MRKIFVLFFAVVMALGVNAQKADDPVIFEINGKKIYKSEFMKEFLRSVGKDPSAAPTACTYEKRQALMEYVDLFVNYRVKLEDAYEQGFDTMPDMIKELTGYRNELAAPYLIDSVTLDQLLKEAYERMAARKNEVESGSAVKITDDAMVMEQFGTLPVHVSSGSYRNIKITTPEDMLIAEAFLRQ